MPDLIGFSGLSSSSVTNVDTPTGGFISVSDYARTFEVQGAVWNIWTNSSSTTTGISTTSAVNVDFGTTGSSICHFIIEQNTDEAIRIGLTPAFLSNTHTQYWQASPAFHRPVRAPLTPEQVAQNERRRQQRLRENARSRRFREAAQHRAENLLRSVLNAEQRAELEQHGHFHVRTQGTNRVYRIERGFQGNVKLMVEGRAIRRYCIHADSRLPYADQMAAQKLMLETNEHEFLRIANMTTIRY